MNLGFDGLKKAKGMLKFAAFAMLLGVQCAQAETVLQVKQARNGDILFKSSVSCPSDACYIYAGDYTPDVKNRLLVLLTTAKITGQEVEIWFSSNYTEVSSGYQKTSPSNTVEGINLK